VIRTKTLTSTPVLNDVRSRGSYQLTVGGSEERKIHTAVSFSLYQDSFRRCAAWYSVELSLSVKWVNVVMETESRLSWLDNELWSYSLNTQKS
jgi:hypothetical protein